LHHPQREGGGSHETLLAEEVIILSLYTACTSRAVQRGGDSADGGFDGGEGLVANITSERNLHPIARLVQDFNDGARFLLLEVLRVAMRSIVLSSGQQKSSRTRCDNIPRRG